VIDGMSGGYKSAFSIGSESLVTAEIIFKLDQVIGNDPGAFSEALCSMDSKLLGVAGNVDYLARLLGGGSGGPVQSTGFQTVTVSAGTLPLGSHNVAVGGYKSRKSFSNETTTIVIDRIRVYATKVSQRAFKLEVDGETRENMNETSYYLVPLLLVASFALVVSQRRKSSAGTAAAAASPPLNHANFCEDTPQESGQPLLPVDSPGNEDEMPYYVGNRIWL
jgi:hypothetical protein